MNDKKIKPLWDVCCHKCNEPIYKVYTIENGLTIQRFFKKAGFSCDPDLFKKGHVYDKKNEKRCIVPRDYERRSIYDEKTADWTCFHCKFRPKFIRL